MTILSILNELAADNSRLAKEAILRREKDNGVLVGVIKACYDPYVNYWQVKIPEYSSKADKGLSWALAELPALSNRDITGNEAIKHFAMILSSLSKDDAEVLERVIKHDLRCGFSDTTANKIWPDLIPTFDVCLAHKNISHITYPAYAQIKYDGGRCHLHFSNGEATAWSRNGKKIEFHGALNSTAKLLMQDGETWDGEIVFRNEKGGLLDRKASNGLFNKGVKGTISPDEARYATFISWDIVDFTGTIPYKDRVEVMGNRWSKLNEKQKHEASIWVVRSNIVNNADEAQEFYINCINDKHEGAILKNIDFVWEPKRVKWVGKMKAEEEADLRVVAYHNGTGKYSGMMGAVTVETSDGKLRTNVGSGWSDAERRMAPEEILDKIITVKYNQLIKSKDDDKKWALFLPRVIEIRTDKTVANRFEELK